MDDWRKLTAARAAGLFLLFLLIACGLGYPILNRYDPRQTPGLADVKGYAAIVTGTASDEYEYVRFRQFRVLVPLVAKPFYRLAKGRSGGWDPAMFGLLVSDSIFVAATAVLIVTLGARILCSYAVGLVAALLYLLDFAIPNLRLAGLVDAGEGFFLLVLLWSLSEKRLWALPLIAVLGAMTKESFVPISVMWTAAWWFVMRKRAIAPIRSAVWISSSCVASFATMVVLHWWITGHLLNPLAFAATLRGDGQYGRQFASILRDRNFLYIFAWLLPMAIPNLKRFPKSWIIPIGAACATALALDIYHGVEGGAVFRAWFSIAGPVLALSAAQWLVGGGEVTMQRGSLDLR